MQLESAGAPRRPRRVAWNDAGSRSASQGWAARARGRGARSAARGGARLPVAGCARRAVPSTNEHRLGPRRRPRRPSRGPAASARSTASLARAAARGCLGERRRGQTRPLAHVEQTTDPRPCTKRVGGAAAALPGVAVPPPLARAFGAGTRRRAHHAPRPSRPPCPLTTRSRAGPRGSERGARPRAQRPSVRARDALPVEPPCQLSESGRPPSRWNAATRCRASDCAFACAADAARAGRASLPRPGLSRSPLPRA
jgi:hypothetical protein